MKQHNIVEMEMSVLSNLNVVIEDDSDYVFIQDNDMEFDDESYDHCDLSPDLSCAASVCSGVTLSDFKIESSMISLEDRNDSGRNEDKKGGAKLDIIDSNTSGRRLSNKKRRKKLKMIKKAAAAAHFEAKRNAQLAASVEAESSTSQTNGPERSAPASRSLKRAGAKSKKSSVQNLAVACANESLAAYREEIGRDQKKSSLVRYVL